VVFAVGRLDLVEASLRDFCRGQLLAGDLGGQLRRVELDDLAHWLSAKDLPPSTARGAPRPAVRPGSGTAPWCRAA